MRRLIPDSIATRTLLVLIVGLTVSHLFSIAIYFSDRSSALLFTGGEHTSERIATISRIIESSSPSERRRIAELADSPKLHVAWGQESAVAEQPDGSWQSEVLRDALNSHLDDESSQVFRLRHTTDVPTEFWQRHLVEDHDAAKLGETMLASLQLHDGSWLNFAAPVEAPQPFWSMRFVISMVVMLLAVAILSAVVVHRLARPLKTFARAAQRLGKDVKAPPIPETGPIEVRQATHAFNDMQERIRRFVDDRTQMLAAISHDLGTPITRLRLRAEFVDDDEQRTKMLADLDDMEKMVSSALSFARDEAACEPYAKVDLRTLVRRVCDDTLDAGHAVSLELGDDAVPYSCRPAALRRALANLIENAVKYGARAHVSLGWDKDEILLEIDDSGPGIPVNLQEEAFKPFRRLEGSRSRETGGTGLGLTVARAIIRAHGGEVSLHNRSEGGLRVIVRLPS